MMYLHGAYYTEIHNASILLVRLPSLLKEENTSAVTASDGKKACPYDTSILLSQDQSNVTGVNPLKYVLIVT